MSQFKNLFQEKHMRIKEISAFDTLGLVKKNQIFEDIQIYINVPFSSFVFKKENSILGICCFLLKFCGGFNECDNFQVFLNKKEIIFDWLSVIDDDDNLIKVIEKFKPFLEENNEILVELTSNFKSINYIQSCLVYVEFFDETWDFNKQFELNKK